MFDNVSASSPERGILYIATEDDFIEEAEKSAQSVRETMGEIPIALVTSRKWVDSPPGIFDIVLESQTNSGDFGVKVQNIHKTPFKNTIYFDTDIYLGEGVNELFEILNEWDVAAAHNLTEYNFGEVNVPKDHPLNTLPEGVPEYNTGVIAFKSNEDVSNLFSDWREEYRYDCDCVMDHPPDQASFRRSLYNSGVGIHTLTREYNCIFRTYGRVSRRVKVFHGRLKEVNGHGARQGGDVTDAVQEINRLEKNRVYFTSLGKTVVTNRKEERAIILFRLIRRIKLRDLKTMIGNLIKDLLGRIY
ncbi:hypothetical protein [Haloprofundus marisrubri]|uniref:hypothetical protein n=1 Tax=Haloprofundus marisrubri TaxID=1514971 RepID=UPI0012BA6941|nr:hypothetical protein [Haloprofundus marisrubri]